MLLAALEYRCLFSSVPSCRLPAGDPRHFTAKRSAEIDGCVKDRHLIHGCPELKLISLAATLVTLIPAFDNIDRERSAGETRRLVYWARAAQLVAVFFNRSERKLLQDFGHLDLLAHAVEVNARHDLLVSELVLAVSGSENLCQGVFLCGIRWPLDR